MIRPVEESDFKEIFRWHELRGMRPPDIGSMPGVGLIQPGVAAVFLYRTDSDVCLLDCAVSNPEAERSECDEALDSILRELVKIASGTGFRKIFAMTRRGSIAKRLERESFQTVGEFQFFAKEIK